MGLFSFGKDSKRKKKSEAQNGTPPTRAEKDLPDNLDFRSPVAGRIALNELIRDFYWGNIKSEQIKTICFAAQCILGYMKLEKDIQIEHQIKELRKEIAELRAERAAGKLEVV